MSEPLRKLIEAVGRGADLESAATSAGLPVNGPASLLRAGTDLVVSVRFAERPDRNQLAAISAVSVIRHIAQSAPTISVAVAPDDVTALAHVSGVREIDPALAPMIAGTTVSTARSNATAATSAVCSDPQADANAVLRSAIARKAHSVDGAGIRIGIISDSFDTSRKRRATADIKDGLLPGPANPCGYRTAVSILADSASPGTDEGRAMAEVVHGIAPGAQLFFHADGDDDPAMVDAIAALRAEHVDIIVDDVASPTEPVFQRGMIGNAVVAAEQAGIPYLTSVGNQGNIGFPGTPSAGRPIGSWETTQYLPTSCPAAILATTPHRMDCEDFGAASGGSSDPGNSITVLGGSDQAYGFDWAEPIGGVTGAFHAYLIDPQGHVITMTPVSRNAPSEYTTLAPTRTTRYAVVIARDLTAGAAITPRLRISVLHGDGGLADMEYSTSGPTVTVGPTAFGHVNEAVAVGAVDAKTGALQPTSSSQRNDYVFAPYIDDTTPAPRLPQQIRHSGPSVLGADDEDIPFFDPSGFTGTSAAAPSVAAVLALAASAGADLHDPNTLAALEQTTRQPLMTKDFFDPAAVGGGLVDAAAFLDRVAPTASTPGITEPSTGQSSPKARPGAMQLAPGAGSLAFTG